MRVLGLDPSASFGIVVLDIEYENVVTTFSSDYTSKSKGMERLGDIAAHILKVVEKYEPELIGLEGFSYGSKFNHEFMYGVGTIVRYFLWQQGYDYQLVPPSTLKKFVTGKGNSKKAMILKEVYKLWHFDATTDNEADAFAIAMCAYLTSLGVVDKKGVWKKGDAPKFTFDHSLIEKKV